MKFKILHTESSTGWGGQEIRILREAEGMRSRGHEVFIFASSGSPLLEKSSKEGFFTKAIRFKRRNFLNVFYKIKSFIEKNDVDIVNTHSSKDSWLSLPAARLAKNKPLTIRTRHLSTPISKNLLSKFLYNFLPHFIITTGKTIREQMISKNRFNPDKIVSIPTGIDTNEFNPEIDYEDIRKELNLKPFTPLIGSISVIRSWKGLDYLIQATPLILKEIPEMRVIITGDGPYKGAIQKTIKKAGMNDKIYLLEHREDIVNILKSIDIFVHPSYANEGVPQAILQAMAMKKPIVASDIPSLREVIIEAKTGILIKTKDPVDIAQAVIRLFQRREFSKQLGENARKLVETSYSFASMINRLEDLYHRGIKEVRIS